MKCNVDDKVRVRDSSYSFGVVDGEYSGRTPTNTDLIVIQTGLSVMKKANGRRMGPYTEVNDLLVIDNMGGFWFTQSRFCNAVDKKIEIRYFCNGEDITGNISDETKRNLKT